MASKFNLCKFNALGSNYDVEIIGGMPDLVKGGNDINILEVQNYLRRYGYLDKSTAVQSGTLDELTSQALKRYQKTFGIPETGNLDEETRRSMTKSRCGLPDMDLSSDFFVASPWENRDLKYRYGTLSSRVGDAVARNAIRRAFDTWEKAGVGLKFIEDTSTDNPDIFVEWRPANDPDHNMVGAISAHADYPPGSSVIVSGPPLPLHFDDQEHIWVDGQVPDGLDIETAAVHEIGHCLGLYHSFEQESVMFAITSPNVTKRNLAADDIDGIRNLYPNP